MIGAQRERADVVVVGAGIAGLTAALDLAPRRVVVLSKTALGAGAATAWAQGGIAAAVGHDDSPELHAADTMAVAGGIADSHAVEVLTHEASERIADLVRFGADFDRAADGEFVLGREGAHGRRRILHAGGDATGRALLDALVGAVQITPSIQVVEGAIALELLRHDGRVVGILADVEGERIAYTAPAVVLATGGIGALYARTTNPLGASGDGLAMAARAGAVLADLEFVQFHPTALDVGQDPMPLVTEALRGEGATIVDDRGERFLCGIHPLAELASRDVVARAIYERRRSGSGVFVDARHVKAFAKRFPTVLASCRLAGIDPAVQPIPVAPAAHYHMGGISVDDWGRSSLAGLWACGEVAATGVHGANRLASNSLLEGVVFAERVARDIAGVLAEPLSLADAEITDFAPATVQTLACDAAAAAAVRRVMDENVGVVRDGEGLRSALESLDCLARQAPPSHLLANHIIVARAVAEAALARPETRGSHARRDHPAPRAEYAHRSFVTPAQTVPPVVWPAA
ncbi:MAG TPA: L-aspartate oxidase [Candidatus Acidoferrales bacterium]|nr:L-aspartate oxidase [Candidatus Acidoferrales bacterium]